MNYTQTLNTLATVVNGHRPDWETKTIARLLGAIVERDHLTMGQALDAAMRAAGDLSAPVGAIVRAENLIPLPVADRIALAAHRIA